jgi:hypothetical protein
MKHILLIALAMIPTIVLGDNGGSDTEWTQSQLSETYMRSLRKEQCVSKTIETLHSCDTSNCLKTMGGVLGDCFTWAHGSHTESCASMVSQVATSCLSNHISGSACFVLVIGRETLCPDTSWPGLPNNVSRHP